MTSPRVTVVGTSNRDLVVRVPRFPAAGETILGASYQERLGGKGANQALAAALAAQTAFSADAEARVRVSLVAAVGNDDAGAAMRQAQRDAGVDVGQVVVRPAPSGRAIVEVEDGGDNRIVVITGANALLTAADVRAALDACDPDVVLTQLESPREVTEATATWAADRGRRLVLNPSPATELPAALLAAADPLIVNEGEAQFYAGRGALASLAEVARSVVITRGARGVTVLDGAAEHTIAVAAVPGVDTTGAGDRFAGTLLTHLALGASLPDAARHAATAATDLLRERQSEFGSS